MATAVARKTATEQGGQFRVLVGIHIMDGPPGCECDGCLKSGGKNHVYEAYDAYLTRCRREKRHPNDILSRETYDNDVFESRVDMVRRFNQENARKFERLAAGLNPVPPEPFPLEKMTIAQLIAVAAEEEIDLKAIDFRTKDAKDEVIALIRGTQ